MLKLPVLNPLFSLLLNISYLFNYCSDFEWDTQNSVTTNLDLLKLTGLHLEEEIQFCDVYLFLLQRQLNPGRWMGCGVESNSSDEE